MSLKRRNALLGASVLVVLLGLAVDYAGRDTNSSVAPGLDSASFDSDQPEVVTETGLKKIALGQEGASGKQISRRHEGIEDPVEFPSDFDEAAWIQERIELINSMEPANWNHAPNEGNPDDPEFVPETNDARSTEYDRQMQLLAELDGHLPLPTGLPDEDETEYVYEGLPEIGEEDPLNMLEADEQALDLQELESEILPHPPGEELLPPAY